jgi:hypothetical protein
MKSRHALKVKIKQHEVNKQTHPFQYLKAAKFMMKRETNFFQLTLTEKRMKTKEIQEKASRRKNIKFQENQ